MPSTFEDTMKNEQLFEVYKQTLTLLLKAVENLAKLGGEPLAIHGLVRNLETLKKQLENYISQGQGQEAVKVDQDFEYSLQSICRMLNIDRAAD